MTKRIFSEVEKRLRFVFTTPAALVGDEEEIDLTGRTQGVVEFGVVHAGNAERVLDSELFKGVDGEESIGFLHGEAERGGMGEREREWCYMERLTSQVYAILPCRWRLDGR